MDIIERAKAIIVKPKETWGKIKGETTTIKGLFTSYAVILALIPAVANFIGWSLIGSSAMRIHYRVPVASGLVSAVLLYVLTLAALYAVAFIIDALAPSFNSKKDMLAATKVAVFSFTPAMIAGIFGIIPGLSILVTLASLYSLYLFYVGLPILMETPKEKTFSYCAVVMISSILVWIAAGSLAGLAYRIPSVVIL